jgi:hypothetical protein
MLSEKVAFYFQKQILEKLPEDIREKVAVAGGAVRDKLLDVDIKDYDLFVQDKETEDKLIEFYKANGKEGNVNSQLANYTYEGKWIQIIRGKYYNMETTELIDSFDFTITMAMVTMKHGLRVGEFFYQGIATKHLRINRLDFPLSSLERMQKYIKKGYTACNGTLLTLTRELQKVNLDNPQENSLTFYSDGTPRFLGVD